MPSRVRNAVLEARPRRLLLVVAVLLAVLGVAAVWIGRHVRAEFHLRRAQQAMQECDHSQRRANLAAAREDLAACLKVWPDSAEVHFLLARAARRAGDYEDARRRLDRAAKLGWVDEAVDLERVLLRAQQGEGGAVEQRLWNFVDREHPEKELILEALAWGYFRSYQLQRCLVALDRLLQSRPDHIQALRWRGETRLLLGPMKGAAEDLERAVDLDPDEAATRQKLGDMLLGMHRATDALPHFERLHEHAPDNPEVLLGLASCLCECGRTEEAAENLDRLLALAPDHARGLAERGKLALAAGQPAAAEKYLRRSLALAPFEREPAYNLYRCLQAAGRPEEAAPYRERVAAIDADHRRLEKLKAAVLEAPHNAEARCEIGKMLLRNGQDQEGLRWLHSALKEDPRHAPTRAALDKYYQDASRRGRAVAPPG
jgi:tetratricopeptide (TPR) repeat protein